MFYSKKRGLYKRWDYQRRQTLVSCQDPLGPGAIAMRHVPRIEMSARVNNVWTGLTPLAGLNNDMEYLYDVYISNSPPPPPIISGTTVINFLQEPKLLSALITDNHCTLQYLARLKSIFQALRNHSVIQHDPYTSMEKHIKSNIVLTVGYNQALPILLLASTST